MTQGNKIPSAFFLLGQIKDFVSSFSPDETHTGECLHVLCLCLCCIMCMLGVGADVVRL